MDRYALLSCPRPPLSGPYGTSRQRSEDRRAGGPHRTARVGVVLVSRGIARRGTGPHRRLALGRAHEFQGHGEHSPRGDEGNRRTIRRNVERLYVDRSDDLCGDGGPRRARSDAVPRSRAHGARPLRTRRVRVGADGDHLGAPGRRERSRSAARHRGDRDRVPGASVRASDDRLDRRSQVDDPRRSVRPLPPLLHPEQRDARRRGGRRCGRRAPARRASISAASLRGAAPERIRIEEPPQLGERRVLLEREGHDGLREDCRFTRRRPPSRTSSRCSSSTRR